MIFLGNGQVRFTLALVLVLAGCTGNPANGPPSPRQSTQSGNTDLRRGRLDAALAAAADYLMAAESPDGAWRSDVYGAFKHGDALTPLVVMSLMDLPESAQRQTTIEKGTRYLANLVLGDGTKASTRVALTYPVYTAAGAVTVMSRSKDVHLGPALAAWLTALRESQLVEALGWQPDDPFYGGWGYAKDLPKKPTAGQPLSPLAEPNLSATAFALEALCATGVDNTDPAVSKALHFVQRCQNYSDDAARLDPSFDDGGFFFIQNDPTRNKAGAAGLDGSGRERYTSYGSSTADGLRALLLCGLQVSEPRVVAARRWLETHYSITAHPGAYRQDREATRAALYFYYCRSLAYAFNAVGEIAQLSGEGNWRNELADELMRRQRADGAWINAAVDVREDDPLVATPLAVMALAACRGSHEPSNPTASIARP